MNNLLAIASGQYDIWSTRPISADPAFRGELDRLRTGTAEAFRLLRTLSELSRPSPAEEETEAELDLALDAVRALALPLANESGVELAVERIGGDALIGLGPGRLRRALPLAVLGAVAGLGRGGRVRLRALVGRGRVAFALTATRGLAGDVRRAIDADLAELAPVAVTRTRAGWGVNAWRVVAPARTALAEPGSIAARGHARVLLVEADEPIADLIASVLREEGYGVEIALDLEQGLARAHDCGVLILDRDLGVRAPALAAQLIASVPRTLLLGDPIPGIAAVAETLTKPCAPNDLVRAVAHVAMRP